MNPEAHQEENGEINYGITYMWNLDKMLEMNLFTTEIDSQTQKEN